MSDGIPQSKDFLLRDVRILPITDHAIIRWLERIDGVDIRALEERILTEDRRALLEFCHEGKIIVPSEGAELLIRDGTVITVVAQ